METRTKLEIGSFITMALLISGAYFIAPGDIAYYCESRDLVMLCEKLSSGLGTRCYFEDTYKICKEGWIKFEEELTVGNFTDYLCSGEMIKECINQEGKLILRVKA